MTPHVPQFLAPLMCVASTGVGMLTRVETGWGHSNSCSVRRSDSPLLPYELLDRVYGSKGYWHDMMQADPSERDPGLTEEELAAVLGMLPTSMTRDGPLPASHPSSDMQRPRN